MKTLRPPQSSPAVAQAERPKTEQSDMTPTSTSATELLRRRLWSASSAPAKTQAAEVATAMSGASAALLRSSAQAVEALDEKQGEDRDG